MLDRRQLCTAGAAFCLAPRRALAQTELSQPVRILVGFPAGGSADVIARLVAEQIKSYSATVIVDNRPGAGGRIALAALKSAPNDGATLAITPASMLVIYPHIYSSLDYNPATDFTPIAPLAASPFLLTVGSAVPASVRNLADFVEWCKANPAKANYGSSGAGSMPHFTGVMLAQQANFEFTHVPYKGGAPAIQDLLGGQVASNLSVLSNALPHVRSGALRALAISGPVRSVYLPDVPTFREIGYPALEAVEWFGLLAPAGLSASRADRLNKIVREALQSQQAKEALSRQSFETTSGSPTDFTAQIGRDIQKWGPIIKTSGFTATD